MSSTDGDVEFDLARRLWRRSWVFSLGTTMGKFLSSVGNQLRKNVEICYCENYRELPLLAGIVTIINAGICK